MRTVGRVGAGALVLAAVVVADAQVEIYSTGFEAPGMVLGTIEGQDFWSSDPFSTNGVVQNNVVSGGSQALRIDAAGLAAPGSYWFFRPLNYTVVPSATPLVQVAWDWNIGSTAGTASTSWVVEFFESTFIARYGLCFFSDTTQTFWTLNMSTSSASDTGVVIPKNTWVHLRAVLDFENKLTQYYVNGVQAGGGVAWDADVFPPGNTIADFDFRVTNPGVDSCHVDRFRVVATRRPCAGDANGDGQVNFADVTSTLANFGAVTQFPNLDGDANGDLSVAFSDVTATLANFGLPCP